MTALDKIDTYRKMLRINKHRLDDELEIQAEMMMQIGDALETATSRMMEAKDELARIEGRVGESLKEDDPKLSIPALEAKVKRAPERTRAWERYQAAMKERGQWDRLWDSWKERGQSIKTLGSLFGSQYFASDPIVQRERTRRKEEDYAVRREEMRALHTAEPATARRRMVE